MYVERNIIYFDPFHFDNGNSKRKYFLILKNLGGTTLIASLPSSVAHLPPVHTGKHGCVDDHLSGISCYILEKDRIVTENGFAFPKETYLHGHWISEHDLASLTNAYQVEGIDYNIIGRLLSDEYNAIVDCFKSSKVVKNKFRRLL